jgi:helicase
MALRATFIGVGKHSDPGIRDLVGSARDAIALHALFADNLPGETPELLVDENATVQNIRGSIANTLGGATADDIVILSFSGHGSHDHRMAATDTRLVDLGATTLGMDELAKAFSESKAKAICCILDCCFSGEAPGKVLEDTPIPRDPATPLRALAGEGRILLSASSENEVAYESPVTRHGLLTKAVLDLLMETEEGVDLLSMGDEVMKKVRAEAARMGVTQTPIMFGNVQGGLSFPPMKPGSLFAAAFPEYGGIKTTADFNDLLPAGIPSAVVTAWKGAYSGLNDLQIQAVNEYGILDGRSLLVVAPTSSGKTFLGELAAAKAIAEGRKAVFLLPYKALVNEKFDQFSRLYGDVLGMRVIRCSGDYSDDITAFIKGKYDIAFFTYEMFLQLSVGVPATLNALGLVVVDEAQFITDTSRGIAVELLLTFLIAARERQISPQLICLSAVIGDVNRFHEWLGCQLLITTKRPIPLIEGVIDRLGTFQSVDENGAEQLEQLLDPRAIRVRGEKASAQDVIVPLIQKLVQAGEKVIVFRNARGPAQGCAKYLARDLGLPAAQDALDSLPRYDLSTSSANLRTCLEGGTAFHNSNLTREERVAVEQSFRKPDGAIRVLAATTTVAAGINTPASTVILAENEFLGEDGRPFSVAEYKNMAGRAGRLGFNERGKSIIYAESSGERQLLFNRYVRGRLERLESSFDIKKLNTWLIRLLVQIKTVRRADVCTLLTNTFGGYSAIARDPQWRQMAEGQIGKLTERMIALGLLEVEGDNVSLSLLGRACGRSSLLFESALRLVDLIKQSQPAFLTPMNLVALIQALPSEEMGYTPMMKKGTKESVSAAQVSARYGQAVIGILQKYAFDQMEFWARCKRAAVLFDWMNGAPLEKIEEEFSTSQYYYRLEHGDVRRFADLTRFHLQSAAELLSILLAGQISPPDVDLVIRQLEVGIPSDSLELLDLPIPLTRGEYLSVSAYGVKTVAQVWEMDPAILKQAVSATSLIRLEELRPK